LITLTTLPCCTSTCTEATDDLEVLTIVTVRLAVYRVPTLSE
jgi:hypothetical protein